MTRLTEAKIKVLADAVLAKEEVLESTGYKQGYFRCDHCWARRGQDRRGNETPIKHKMGCAVIVARRVIAGTK